MLQVNVLPTASHGVADQPTNSHGLSDQPTTSHVVSDPPPTNHVGADPKVNVYEISYLVSMCVSKQYYINYVNIQSYVYTN